MKAGQVINGYKILRDFSTDGSGFSKWTFAEKYGEEFFIKEFLSPTYPHSDSPGSKATKELKREKCRLFEEHHKRLWSTIAPSCADGGNLIATKDFFRSDAKYYKVTEKVDVSGLTPLKIARLDSEKQLIILKTVCHSLGVLHNLDIVHGDLKPNNILIKQTVTGSYTAKLIDFDNSYFSGKPPILVEEMVGDMVYYSPELALYISEAEAVKPTDLTLRSDIFALGLIYHQYLTGEVPEFDTSKYTYARQSVLGGDRLRVKTIAGMEYLSPLIGAMLDAKPENRPGIRDVFAALKSTGKPTGSVSTRSTGRLKISMHGHTDTETPSTADTTPTTGKLKISMGSKKP